jgi:divalent metal cation (Fe/Co/Zn/Cd) transporter
VKNQIKIITTELKSDRELLNLAMILSLITIGYNLIEGVISTFFGTNDDTLALFGFGVDSFVEVISGIGIAHMVWRMKRGSAETTDSFEITALRITGFAFYLLTVGLAFGALWVLLTGIRPETTLAGIIISVVSIITMFFLYRIKLGVGKRLDSAPIISDAKCTKTCFYLSFILLASSTFYEIFRIPLVDVLGSLGIAWYAFREGREAFEKARQRNLTCGDDHCN